MNSVSEITKVISSVGFPIVACGALFWMINTSMKELTNAIAALTASLRDAQHEEVKDE